MKIILAILTTLLPLLSFAGGSNFEAQIIEFRNSIDSVPEIDFIPLNTPYGTSIEKFTNGKKRITIRLEWGCNQSWFTCTFVKRTFSKEQHKEALTLLIKQAKKGKVINFGVMSEGFYPNSEEPTYYISNGLFISEGIVYSYVNSHL